MSLFKSICCLGLLLFAGCEAPETPTAATPLPPRRAVAQSARSLRETWQLFAAAVMKNDVVAIKVLSARKIHCADCVTNTPQEAAAWEAYQQNNPDNSFDKLYKELAYIDAEVFIREDAAIIFDKRIRSRLLDKSKLGFLEKQEQPEVLVTIIDPSNVSEGMQAVFAFEKTREGYRFCGYSTIP